MKTILSIDGGGIRGLMPAMILSEIETLTDMRTFDLFDMIAGTSTGGILAMALAKPKATKPDTSEYSASDLCAIYKDKGRLIFPEGRFSNLKSMIEEKYSSSGLESVLEEYFDSIPLDSALTDLLITSYEIQTRRPVFFKSWKNEYRSLPMRDIGRATSAAPTFFEPASFSIDGSQSALIDGGIFINSPALAAYVECMTRHPKESDFFILSIGTGQMTRSYSLNDARGWGKAKWLVPLMNCMFDGNADAVDYQLGQLLPDGYWRLQMDLVRTSDDMDDASPENLGKLEDEVQAYIKLNQSILKRISQLLVQRRKR